MGRDPTGEFIRRGDYGADTHRGRPGEETGRGLGGPAGLTLGPEKTPSRNLPARGWSMHICVCVHAHSHTHSHTQVSFIYVYISYTYIFIDNFQIFKTVRLRECISGAPPRVWTGRVGVRALMLKPCQPRRFRWQEPLPLPGAQALGHLSARPRRRRPCRQTSRSLRTWWAPPAEARTRPVHVVAAGLRPP